ncbi:MAG: SusC/RagA family TonB-linked outer membrane protein [Sphingobacteriia bacterium]|nr:SusC/RagA family TonB-linked outer membrane protein [Sphingobacteriia bacterium]
MRKKLLLSFCAMLLCIGSILAQNTLATGKITDDKGAGIGGATILEKGTKNGTSTNNDGTFSLKVRSGAKLIVTALGFENKEIVAGSDLMIQLVTDVKSLSEVVVTGTGVATSKKRLGFAVESIRGDKLPQVPIASIDQALVGKVAGAQISSVSGNPGDQVNIVLRGINTIQGGTRPMILLDGVEIPFASLSYLDLTQVERVEVVQGAASSALYGAQGANGVIQIFSKKGTKGQASISVSSSYAYSSYINAGNFGKASLHPYLTDANGNIISATASGGFNAGDPLKIDPVIGNIMGSGSIAYKYGSDNGGTAPGETQSYTRYGILDPRNNANQPYKGNLHYYDHFAQVFQSAPSYNNSISVSGGSDKMDYNFSMANNRTYSALMKDNGYLDRTNFVSNLGFEVFKNFTIRSITNLVYTNNTMHPHLGAPGGPGYGYGTSNADVGGVYGFLNTSPFFSLTDTITGGVPAVYQRASFLSVNAFNPYYRMFYTKGDSKRYDIIQSFDANYRVNKYLTFNARYGISYKNENDIWTFYNQSLNANSNYYSTWTSEYNGTDNTGEINNFQYNQTKQNLTTTATVKLDFEKDFHIKLPIQSSTLIGYDYRKNTYKELGFVGQSLPLTPPFNFANTQQQYIANDYDETFVTYGYLLDEKIDYGNYGGITGGFRTDYSSAFGKGSSPFTFPHFNGYLNLTAFNFWDPLSKAIPNFKLRAAYGKAGIQPGAYQRQTVLNSQLTGNQAAYSNPLAVNDPNLNVEVSAETEYGTDLTFSLLKGNWFKNLNASFTYWTRHTDNAIFAQNVAPSTGATSITTNTITLSSKGWQLGLNIPVYMSKNLVWDLTANFGHQSSTIDNIVGGDIPLTSAAGSSGLILKAGAKVGQVYGYKALTSVSQLRSDGTPFIPTASQSGYAIVNGMVVNTTTKSIFFSDEAHSLGDPNPTLISSFINSFTYKGFLSFSFQFDWVKGSHLYNQTNEWMYRDGISNDFQNPVTIGGQTGAWTAYYASAYYALGNTPKGVGNNVTKDYFWSDASFVRLRNVSLGIDFAKFANQKWLKKCQLVLSGRNLLTFTKYHGVDPEISSGASNSAYDRAIDHSTIPNLKAYQATLNFGF